MELFTIGYSGYDREELVEALRRHGVGCVVDVRSIPASAYRSEYNGEPLKHFLKKHGILYGHMGAEFGAQQEDARFYHADGYMDFEAFADSEAFKRGMRRIASAARMGIVCALMCAEKDAMNCHRSILIARHFHERGWRVTHLMPQGNEAHERLENRLLDEYFPERGQLSLLEESRTDAELLKEAYRLQNRKIGFRRNEGKEE